MIRSAIVFVAILFAVARAADPLHPPPASLGLSSFYQKYVDALGIPVVSSTKPPDAALYAAADIVRHMLKDRNDIVQAMIKNKTRVAVMAETEKTTDIPEHSDLTPKDFWDARARGLGATPNRPASSCAEENLLGYDTDPYHGESIMLHEFAHSIHIMGLNFIDPTFDKRLNTAYENAKAKGLFANTYAITDHFEYWAEGVQDWFDTNIESIPSNGIHNEINTREELQAYDPALAALCAEVFKDTAFRFDQTALHITSGPLALPNPGKAGEAVTLICAADAKDATFTWDFGDGSASASGDTVTHSFAANGMYTVSVKATSAARDKSASSTVTVAVGMSLPTDPGMTKTATVGKRKFAVNFVKKSGSFSIELGSMDFIYSSKTAFAAALSGKKVTVSIGTTQVDTFDFTTSKPVGAGKLSWNIKKGEISYSLKSPTLPDILSPLGASSADTPATTITIPVSVVVDGKTYQAQASFVYSAKGGKGTGK